MYRKPPAPDLTRGGFTMLELVAATTLMAALLAAVGVLLRGSHKAWTLHEQDMARTESASAALRHIVRQLRQCEAVVSVSTSSDLSGGLAARRADGAVIRWEHDELASVVRFGVGSPTEVLAEWIEQLRFVGYTKDGATLATSPVSIQSVKCYVTFTLPHGAGESRTISATAWLRSW